MTAPPSTETPRHTATLNAHIAKYLAQRAPDHDGDVVVVFTSPQRDAFVEVLNSHASLTAKVAELEAALRQIKAETEGDRPTVNPENAFGHWSNLNAALVIIRGLASDALEARP